MKFGSQSEVNQIRNLLIKHPGDAFIGQKNIQAQWKELNYSEPPALNKAIEEYDNFLRILRDFKDIFCLRMIEPDWIPSMSMTSSL